MQRGTIKQSIFIDASPAIVYEVVSTPEHLARWYVDEAVVEASPGVVGHFVFGGPGHPARAPITVIDAVPGIKFSFFWLAPPAPNIPPVGSELAADNAVVVTFSLVERDGGTLLTVTEDGMRELGWDSAVLTQYYDSHTEGWNVLLERLTHYVTTTRLR